jgi:nitrous oxide reductase accessory protein NosL
MKVELRRPLAIALAALALCGCARRDGPPPIAAGTPCAGCGMDIDDLRFASEMREGDRWSAFDDLGCLARAARSAHGAPLYLTDYDSRALVAADSVWIVKGSLTTPMGSGCVAFRRRAAADEVAGQSDGRVMRWGELLAEATP